MTEDQRPKEAPSTAAQASGPRRPAWYEWLWSAAPLLLALQGGLLGLLCGVIAFALNLRQFRTHNSRVYNFMVTALIGIAAITADFVLGVVVALILGGY